jgi:hypothetical protein
MQCPLREVDQSFPSVAKNNNVWFCISVHPYTFTARCLINPLNAELNPIHHLLALLVAHHILHVSRVRIKQRENLNYEINRQDALYRLIYYSKSALHVSGNVFAHHQEHLTLFTVFGSSSNLGEH